MDTTTGDGGLSSTPSGPISEQTKKDLETTLAMADQKEMDKAARYDNMLAVAPALRKIADMVGRVEEAMGRHLADVVKEQALGDVVDLVADIKGAIETLHGDGSTVVTNQLKGRLNYIREVTFPARLEADKVKTFNTDRFRITKTAKVMASIIRDEDGSQEGAFKWLRDNELGGLIKETVNASSLSGAAKEQLENGNELPEELFKVHTKDSVSITKLKPKRG